MQSRRWTTLISADRNRTVVIRREPPRTRNADWVRRLNRIKARRALLFLRPRSVIALFPAADTCVSAVPIQPLPRNQKSLGRRRRDQSRPSEASRRAAWTGGDDAVRLKTREWRSWRLLRCLGFQAR